MNYHWLIPLGAAIGTLSLAIVVLHSRRRREIDDVFCFLAVTLVFWNLIAFVLCYASDENTAFSLARFFRAGALLMLPAIPHLFVSLQTQSSRRLRLALAIDYGIAVAFVLANSVDLLVPGLRHFSWGYYSVGSSLYNLLSLYLVGNFCFAVVLMIAIYWATDSVYQRAQLKFWMLGAAVALPLGLTNLLPAY